MTLRISPDLQLPLDVATETLAILGKRGSGKSNAAVVLFEELHRAGVPCVAIDPKGDWWGLRSAADGKGPGLPVPVFGGRHGDVPLESTAGGFLADLIVERRLSCVIDVSELSRADVVRFLTAFAQRLYRQAADEPMHLFLEECHEYLPQRVGPAEAQLVGAWQRIVKMGRFKGLGCTLVSQRSAAVNKDVLNQAEALVAMRVLAPHDRAAVKGWVEVHGDSAEILRSLHELADGEGWVWAPDLLGPPRRVRFRRRSTFDSGATPKVGEKRREPATLADVDLVAIKEAMAETIEKAKADDPKALRRRIAELERELSRARAETPEPVVERVAVPVPFFSDELVSRLEVVGEPVFALSAAIRDALAAAGDLQRGEFVLHGRQDVPGTRPARHGAGAVAARSERPAQRSDPPARREPRRAPVPGAEEGLKPGPRSLLVVLANRAPAWLTRSQVVVLAKRGQKSSALDGHFNELLDRGLADRNPLGDYRATPEGVELIGVQVPEDPIAMWRSALKGADLKVFDALVRLRPAWLSREEVADHAGLSRTSSAPGQALTNLRRNGLVETSDGRFRAAEALFL